MLKEALADHCRSPPDARILLGINHSPIVIHKGYIFCNTNIEILQNFFIPLNNFQMIKAHVRPYRPGVAELATSVVAIPHGPPFPELYWSRIQRDDGFNGFSLASDTF